MGKTVSSNLNIRRGRTSSRVKERKFSLQDLSNNKGVGVSFNANAVRIADRRKAGT